jgi:hypothetical protein
MYLLRLMACRRMAKKEADLEQTSHVIERCKAVAVRALGALLAGSRDSTQRQVLEMPVVTKY